MRRGEVWWADLPPPIGSRPVVLLARDAAYAVRLSVTVAPVTTRIRNIPSEVQVGSPDGLPRPSVVKLDDIQTIPKSALQRPLGQLRPERLRAVDAAIHYALDLSS